MAQIDEIGHHTDWKFCPGCGKEWATEEGDEQFGCSSCGFTRIHFENLPKLYLKENGLPKLRDSKVYGDMVNDLDNIREMGYFEGRADGFKDGFASSQQQYST